jgi:hypothetical protein
MVTPMATYKDNAVLSQADLQMGPDGSLKGLARISMSGVEALRWRQEALESDEQDAEKKFEASLQERVPAGVQVKVTHFLGLTDNTTALMAVVEVSGNMGTATGKRVFLPGTFFEASEKPPFAAEKRESPIDLRYPWLTDERVTVTLASGLTPESVPANTEVPYLPNADYKAQYSRSANSYTLDRLIAVGNVLFKTEEYPQLREFFQKTGAQDQQQVVLEKQTVIAGQ